MSLAPGSRLGPYEITGALGAGGMGEVYRARDARLDRDVAVKVLAPDRTRDPDAARRFLREAKHASSLNHPNIVIVHDVGDDHGTAYVVMELVAGRALDALIPPGGLPLDRVLRQATEIASALAAAHKAGLVHRDVKPANIMVTDTGTAKVLDFGIATVAASEGGGSSDAVTTTALTTAGMVIGSAGYMSPEQAQGQAVDARSDIFSFGAVLYEMLTGTPAFPGDSAVSALSAVLGHEPAPIEGIPSDLQRLIQLCLRKDRERRLQHMSDVLVLLGEISTEPASVGTATLHGARLSLWAVAAIGVLVVAAGVTGAYLARNRQGAPGQDLRKYRLELEADAGSQGGYDTTRKPVVSPDGTMLAYTRNGRVWIRSFSQLAPREHPGTDGAIGPFWSPDSRFVAFAADGVLKKLDLASGAVATIAPLPQAAFTGGTWGTAGTILVGSADLYEVQAAGGAFRPVLMAEASAGDADFHSPHYLPDGRSFLFVRHPTQNSRFSINVRADGVTKLLVGSGDGVPASPVYDRRGHLVYEHIQQGKTLRAVPFSLDRLAVSGDPVVVANDAGGPSVSLDGTLVFIEGGSASGQELVVLDRRGQVELSAKQAFDQILHLVASPDGSRVAFAGARGGNHDLWVYDLGRSTLARITTTPVAEDTSAWSPDGTHLAVASAGQVLLVSADGSGTPRVVTPAGREFGNPAWRTNGEELVVQSVRGAPIEPPELFSVRVGSNDAASPLFKGLRGAFGLRISPDGGLVAYTSASSGRNEVYVQPFPTGAGLWQVSTNGGTAPQWNRRPDELLYLEGAVLMSVPITSTRGFKAGAPARLFSGEAVGVMLYSFSPTVPAYAPHPDGKRVVAVRASGGRAREAAVVVENWRREFEQ